MSLPSRASEFPNDNAEISGGATWIVAELTGPARLVLAPYRPVSDGALGSCLNDQHEAVDCSTELKLALTSGAASPGPVDTIAESETSPAFSQFEAALTAALMAHGASRSAALVPKLLRLQSMPADALGKDVRLTLQSRGYLDGNARYSQKFRELCGAWFAVLQGSSKNLAACGTTTLDRFGADLLAALLAVPATRADDLRRQLRKAGIAAFGVLEAA